MCSGDVGLAPDRGAEQVPRRPVDVQDDLEVQVVQRLEVLRGLVERLGVELERAVADVPAGRAVAGAEIDQGVARQLLVAEGLGDLQRLLRPGQRAVRLHVTERPLRRHHRLAGQADVFREAPRRFGHVDDEHLQRLLAASVLARDERPVPSRKSNSPDGPVDEHRPAVGADQEGNGMVPPWVASNGATWPFTIG